MFLPTIKNENNEWKQTHPSIPSLPPLLNPFSPQTVAIAIAISVTILIIINQPPIPLSPPIPFVAHKFSGAFSLHIV